MLIHFLLVSGLRGRRKIRVSDRACEYAKPPERADTGIPVFVQLRRVLRVQQVHLNRRSDEGRLPEQARG